MAEPPSAFYTRVFGLVSAGLLAFLLFRILQPFIGPILWSVLLAFLLFPVIRALRRVLGNRQTAAASVLTFGMVLVIIGPVTLLGVAFTRQAAELFSRMQSGQVTMIRPSDLLRVPIVDRLMQWAESVAPISAEQVEQWFVNAAKGLLAAVVAGSGDFVVEALGTVLNLVVMLFLLFFFLRDGEEMVRKARALIPMEPERQEHLVAHLAAVTRAVVLGSLVTALVQGTLVGLAFVLVGCPRPWSSAPSPRWRRWCRSSGRPSCGCPRPACWRTRAAGGPRSSWPSGAASRSPPPTTSSGPCSSRAGPGSRRSRSSSGWPAA